MSTLDKLIFPLAITRILQHFSISYPPSDPFFVMGAINAATVRQSIAQLRPRQPHTQMATPSIFAPSFSAGGVTLDAIMAQLQRMDACLDTLSDELCLVNTRVGHITRRQAHLGGFIESPSPTSEAFTTMVTLMMMVIRTIVLSHLVMTRCLLNLLTLCHS